MIRWIDGALLIDLWVELDLPEPIREAWSLAVFIAREPFDIDAEWYAIEQIVPGQTSQVWNRHTMRLRLPKPPPPRRSRSARALAPDVVVCYTLQKWANRLIPTSSTTSHSRLTTKQPICSSIPTWGCKTSTTSGPVIRCSTRQFRQHIG